MGKKNKAKTRKPAPEKTQAGRLKLGAAVPEMLAPSPLGDPKENKKERNKFYERELRGLHIQLVKLQEWVKHEGRKVVLLFEGRDAAGKGGVIKRIIEPLNPRACRVVALGTPTERQKTQWYFQRYTAELPAAGEMTLFVRSWYNRAGVERVMGSCTEAQYWEFVRSCPAFERMLVHTDIKQARWYVVNSDDKKRAHLNCIAHLLSMLPYKDVVPDKIKLPKRKPEMREGYARPPPAIQNFVPEIY